MVPTRTAKQQKPGKWEGIIPVREFCQDWKSRGILLKILEKSEKIEKNTGNVRKICQPIIHCIF